MTGEAGSCSVPLQRPTRRAPLQHNDEEPYKRKKPNHHAFLDNGDQQTMTRKGKKRQSPTFNGVPAAPSQDCLVELLRVAEAHLSSPLIKRTSAEKTKQNAQEVAPFDWDTFLGIDSATSHASSQSTTSQKGGRIPVQSNIETCKECIASSACPRESAETEGPCCVAPCPIACSAAKPITASPCSAVDMACCLESPHRQEAKPTLIACQGVECADAAVIVCNDAECIAPLNGITWLMLQLGRC